MSAAGIIALPSLAQGSKSQQDPGTHKAPSNNTKSAPLEQPFTTHKFLTSVGSILYEFIYPEGCEKALIGQDTNTISDASISGQEDRLKRCIISSHPTTIPPLPRLPRELRDKVLVNALFNVTFCVAGVFSKWASFHAKTINNDPTVLQDQVEIASHVERCALEPSIYRAQRSLRLITYSETVTSASVKTTGRRNALALLSTNRQLLHEFQALINHVVPTLLAIDNTGGSQTLALANEVLCTLGPVERRRVSHLSQLGLRPGTHVLNTYGRGSPTAQSLARADYCYEQQRLFFELTVDIRLETMFV